VQCLEYRNYIWDLIRSESAEAKPQLHPPHNYWRGR